MENIGSHIINKGTLLKDALKQLDLLINEKILFIVDNELKFIGSITDGDIRRGLIKNGSLDQKIETFQKGRSKYLLENKFDLLELIDLRNSGYKVIPLLDNKYRIKDLINLNKYKSKLPISVVLMAGGKGKRLLPLTKNTPKSLLKIGDKPIMEHNVERLISFGIKNFWFSVNYLKDLIKNHFNSGKYDILFKYIEETIPLGTIGALSMIEGLVDKHILILNSDILTNINFEDFYLDFLKKDADISIVTIPYRVKIPFGIVEEKNNYIVNIKEKPTYTYYSNAGIYLIKKEVLLSIPKNTFFDATDLIQSELNNNKKIINYPFSGYWMDIGNHEDFKRAQLDFKNINFK